MLVGALVLFRHIPNLKYLCSVHNLEALTLLVGNALEVGGLVNYGTLLFLLRYTVARRSHFWRVEREWFVDRAVLPAGTLVELLVALLGLLSEFVVVAVGNIRIFWRFIMQVRRPHFLLN